MPGGDGQEGEIQLDLRGIRCPLAWAKAKVRMETLARGAQIALLIDDPRSLRDLPKAAESSGHHVISVNDTTPPWRIVVEV